MAACLNQRPRDSVGQLNRRMEEGSAVPLRDDSSRTCVDGEALAGQPPMPSGSSRSLDVNAGRKVSSFNVTIFRLW